MRDRNHGEWTSNDVPMAHPREYGTVMGFEALLTEEIREQMWSAAPVEEVPLLGLCTMQQHINRAWAHIIPDHTLTIPVKVYRLGNTNVLADGNHRVHRCLGYGHSIVRAAVVELQHEPSYSNAYGKELRWQRDK